MCVSISPPDQEHEALMALFAEMERIKEVAHELAEEISQNADRLMREDSESTVDRAQPLPGPHKRASGRR
jgi:hypothetical protein